MRPRSPRKDPFISGTSRISSWSAAVSCGRCILRCGSMGSDVAEGTVRSTEAEGFLMFLERTVDFFLSALGIYQILLGFYRV